MFTMMPMATECLNLLAAAEGRWLGYDYVLALFGATFPAWALFTLMRGWVRGPAMAPVIRTAGRAISESARDGGVERG